MGHLRQVGQPCVAGSVFQRLSIAESKRSIAVGSPAANLSVPDVSREMNGFVGGEIRQFCVVPRSALCIHKRDPGLVSLVIAADLGVGIIAWPDGWAAANVAAMCFDVCVELRHTAKDRFDSSQVVLDF